MERGEHANKKNRVAEATTEFWFILRYLRLFLSLLPQLDILLTSDPTFHFRPRPSISRGAIH